MQDSCTVAKSVGLVTGLGLIMYLMLSSSSPGDLYDSIGVTTTSSATQTVLQRQEQQQVPPPVDDSMCLEMPTIRPDGVFFLKTKEVKQHESHPLIQPSFVIGSEMEKVSNHMTADLGHFELLKKTFSSPSGGNIAIDVGANQGFFTYYLATLGVFEKVHAFEINQDNYRSLQHGRHYNPKAIADRVYLYPVGLASSTQRLGMKGNAYEGYLAPDPNGSILTTTFDCFAYHIQPDLSKITFMKVDTEGFELSTISGMKSTLPKLPNLKALLVEVGPSRWSRANTSLDDGLELLQNMLAGQIFKSSYVLIRAKGAHSKTCPGTLPNGILADTNPKTVYEDGGTLNLMYQIQQSEWKLLFETMMDKNYDCNFWFENP